MNISKNLLLWVIIIVSLVVLFNIFNSPSGNDRGAMPFSSFMDSVERGDIRDVSIQGERVTGHLQGGQEFSTVVPPGASYVEVLRQNKIQVTALPRNDNQVTLGSILISWFPVLLLLGVWIFFMRQMQGGSRGAMGFGKSKARLLTEKSGRVTFEDVAGIDEAKQELEEVVEFLRDPQKFQRLGGKIPRGVLLVGPPGTGKTLLARAIAGEANVPFFSISGSDFVEMFVGVGASRVRDMFEQGKKNAPCIIFIDEIDAVGRHRGAGLGGGNDEREQTLNQLLVEMDGFEANQSVILVAATNRPDVLDPALLRPGRFDRQVVVPNPDVAGREKILKVHTRKIPLGPDVDIRVIARGTPGFSGADLANLCNEAALLAARKGKRVVGHVDFEEAKDKVLMGAERRSLAMNDEEKRLTAYHEGGHALVTLYSPEYDPVHKATIIPRGRALGLVQSLPERDRLSVTRVYMESFLSIAMAGRIAEELVFGRNKVTSGAASDIQAATNQARRMVTEWGMSDILGPLAYEAPDGEVFLGHSVTTRKTVSEETAREIDIEVRKFVDAGYQRAYGILTEHRDELENIAQALLEYETLTGEELKLVQKGQPITRKESSSASETMMQKSSVPSSGVPSAAKAKADHENPPALSGTEPQQP